MIRAGLVSLVLVGCGLRQDIIDHDTDISVLDGRLTAMEEQVGDDQDTEADLEQQVADLRRDVGSITGSDTTLSDMLGDLKEQVGDEDGDEVSIEEEIAALVGELAAVVGQLGADGNEDETVEEAIARGDGKDAEQDGALGDLAVQLGPDEDPTESVEAALVRIEGLLEDIQDRQDKDQKALQDQIDDLKERVDDHETRITALEDRADDLEDRADDLEADTVKLWPSSVTAVRVDPTYTATGTTPETRFRSVQAALDAFDGWRLTGPVTVALDDDLTTSAPITLDHPDGHLVTISGASHTLTSSASPAIVLGENSRLGEITDLTLTGSSAGVGIRVETGAVLGVDALTVTGFTDNAVEVLDGGLVHGQDLTVTAGSGGDNGLYVYHQGMVAVESVEATGWSHGARVQYASSLWAPSGVFDRNTSGITLLHGSLLYGLDLSASNNTADGIASQWLSAADLEKARITRNGQDGVRTQLLSVCAVDNATSDSNTRLDWSARNGGVITGGSTTGGAGRSPTTDSLPSGHLSVP